MSLRSKKMLEMAKRDLIYNNQVGGSVNEEVNLQRQFLNRNQNSENVAQIQEQIFFEIVSPARPELTNEEVSLQNESLIYNYHKNGPVQTLEPIFTEDTPQYASAPSIQILEPRANIPSCSWQSQHQAIICDESNRMDFNSGSDVEYFDDSDIDPTYEAEKENQQSSSGSDDFGYSLNDVASQIEKNLSASDLGTSTIEKETQKSRKLKRNSGKTYSTAKGIEKAGRICKPLGNCRKKCNLKINYENQKKLFHEYWGLKEYNLRATLREMVF